MNTLSREARQTSAAIYEDDHHTECNDIGPPPTILPGADKTKMIVGDNIAHVACKQCEQMRSMVNQRHERHVETFSRFFLCQLFYT
jgi:hypothetical protein